MFSCDWCTDIEMQKEKIRTVGKQGARGRVPLKKNNIRGILLGDRVESMKFQNGHQLTTKTNNRKFHLMIIEIIH